MQIDYDILDKLARESNSLQLIQDLYGNFIAHKLDKDFDIFVSYNERNRSFECDTLGLKVNMKDIDSYEELYELFQSKVSSASDDAYLKTKFSTLFQNDIALGSKVGEFKIWNSYFKMGFLDMLWWVRTDEYIRDGSIGHGLMDKAQDYADAHPEDTDTFFYPRSGLQYQLRYGEWIDMATVDSEFSGWTIKFFQNGKAQMKGLSKDEWALIENLSIICK